MATEGKITKNLRDNFYNDEEDSDEFYVPLPLDVAEDEVALFKTLLFSGSITKGAQEAAKLSPTIKALPENVRKIFAFRVVAWRDKHPHMRTIREKLGPVVTSEEAKKSEVEDLDTVCMRLTKGFEAAGPVGLKYLRFPKKRSSDPTDKLKLEFWELYMADKGEDMNMAKYEELVKAIYEAHKALSA